MLGNMASRFPFDSLHAQLCSLLENAQCLLADSAPSSTSGYGYYGGGPNTASGRHQPLHHGANPPAVYSFVAMQVRRTYWLFK